MRLFFSGLFIVSTFFSYSSFMLANDLIKTPATNSTETIKPLSQSPTPAVIEINLNASNDGWDDEDTTKDSESNSDEFDENYQQEDTETSLVTRTPNKSKDSLTYTAFAAKSKIETMLPGKDVNFRFNLHTSNSFLIDGRAKSDIGKILFNSKLMPSNEVKLSLKLKQGELDDIELVAYFDLANFTMELDGANSVLNKDHKKILKLTSAHLQPKLEIQYKDYDIPEHALMLVQMLGYWSVSPEGFVHEKRSIVSQ